jgi:hypothetical protein
MPTTKQQRTAKPKHHDTHIKDLRPAKDLRAGGQKKEDPTVNAPPPPNIIAI